MSHYAETWQERLKHGLKIIGKFLLWATGAIVVLFFLPSYEWSWERFWLCVLGVSLLLAYQHEQQKQDDKIEQLQWRIEDLERDARMADQRLDNVTERTINLESENRAS